MASDSAPAPETDAPGWREILAPQYLTRFLFLCLGVWLNAADSLVTVTITPSIAEDIGGFRYFAWSVAAFLLASILSGAASGRLSLRLGLRGALTASAVVYAVGCAMSAAAPDFLTFVAGRLVQGFGAGGIMALCYVATTALFPERLWARVQAKAGATAPKGIRADKAEWVKPGLRGRVKFLRGEEKLRHASLRDWNED